MTTDKTIDEEEQVDHYDMEDPPVIVEDIELDDVDKKEEKVEVVTSTTTKKDDVDITETEEAHDVDDTTGNSNIANNNTSPHDDAGTGNDITTMFKIKEEQLPLAAYIFASMIFLIAVAITNNNIIQWYGYGLSVGIVGMIMGVGGLAMDYFQPNYQKYMSGLLLTWASIGAFIFTFANSSPFRFTGNGKLFHVNAGTEYWVSDFGFVIQRHLTNFFPSKCPQWLVGYFALWGMVISASIHAGVTKEAVQQQISAASSYAGLLICSIIMVIATSFVIADADGYFGFATHKSNTILMICVACFSILLTSGILYQSRIDNTDSWKQNEGVIAKVQFGLVSCFCILWIVSAGLCTFQGPFQVSRLQ